MRLITCSNSAPQVDATTGALNRTPGSPGGLLPIMVSLLDEVGGHWVCTSPTNAPSLATQHFEDGAISLTLISLDERLATAHYGRISIRTLLWLFHYVFDTTYEPTFDRSIAADWAGYELVNRRFAQEMARVHGNSPVEVVLVHDFHLMLVPKLFAQAVGERHSRLVYFHHVPWCQSDYFGFLPEWMRLQILESLLTCDVVGFHCSRWAEAFLGCCERFLPGAKVSRDQVVHRDHACWVQVAPAPIDADTLELLRVDPITEQWRERLIERAAGRKTIVRVDRLDVWKNLIRGFQALELLLEREPSLLAELWFCAILAPPRRPTERSICYRAECEAVVDRINERFGSSPGQRVSLIYPEEGRNSRHRAVAALDLSTATLVNPTLDGLNMVAKEAMVISESAPLLLSVGAGAYEQLRAGVMPIHPFDTDATAEALRAVVASSAGGAPSATLRGAVREALVQETAGKWLRSLLVAGGGP